MYESASRAGDLERSETARARLVALGRDDPFYHLHEAQRALTAGDFDAASEAAVRSLELYPTAEGWFVDGIVHHNAGRLAEALVSYHTSVSMDPRQFQAWHRAGTLLARRGKMEAALDALTRAAQLAPDNPAIARDLAQLRNSAPPQDGDSASP
jgi:cytochrome c-type biogenesis protein CcmH/NrfG